MANLAVGMLGSAPGSLLPGVTLTSMVFILVLLVMLLMFCSSCSRQSFHLQDHKQESNPSSLIHVIKLEETQGGKKNYSHSCLTMNEIGVCPAPENKAMQSDANPMQEAYQPWKNHSSILNAQGEPDGVSKVWSNPSAARESSGSISGILKVQRIHLDPVASVHQVSLRDMDSMLQSGPRLTALGHSDGSTETHQQNHGSHMSQDPGASLPCLQRQKENIYEVPARDGLPTSIILPSAQVVQEEEFENPMYYTVTEMQESGQLHSDRCPPDHVSDPQNGNEYNTERAAALQEEEQHNLAGKWLTAIYAQVSRKSRSLEPPPPPSKPPPEDEDDREEWEGEPMPPLPERNLSTEDCTSLV